MMKNGEIAMIINTPSEQVTRKDEVLIRSTSVSTRTPIQTTLHGARAAAHAIGSLQKNKLEVKPDKARLLASVAAEVSESFPRITADAGICGGSARIVRTRIPVWTLENFRRLGLSEGAMLQVRRGSGECLGLRPCPPGGNRGRYCRE